MHLAIRYHIKIICKSNGRNDMTKKELVYAMALETGLPGTETGKAVNAFIRILKKTLQKGETVQITGFGSFFVSDVVTAKKGKPYGKKQEEVKKVPRFRVSLRFKEDVQKSTKEHGKK